MKKNSVISIFSILTLLLCNAQVFAQPRKSWWRPPLVSISTIQGSVVDSDTNEGISGAKVTAKGIGNYSTTADLNGRYKIQNINVGRWGSLYTITGSDKDYKSNSKRLWIKPGRTYTVNFALRSHKPLVSTIKGRVTDEDTDEGIAGAKVTAWSWRWGRWKGKWKYEVYTNINGEYEIKDVRTWRWGTFYRLTASAEGYRHKSAYLFVKPSQVYTLNFALIPIKPPFSVKITSPQDGAYIRGDSLDVEVYYSSRHGKAKGLIRLIDLLLDGEIVDSYYPSPRDGDNTYIFQINISTLTDGSHNLQAYAYSNRWRRGLRAESNIVNIILDNTPPVITNFIPVDGSLINNAQPEISAILNDTTSGIDLTTIIMKVDGQSVTTSYDSSTGKISYIPVEPLLDALHVVALEVKDKAGNLASVTWSFTSDVTPPVINNLIPEPESTVTEDKPVISANFSDNLSGIDTDWVLIKVDAQDVTAKATITVTKVEYTPVEALSNGEHTVVVKVKDLASNLVSISWVFIVQVGPQIVFEISSDEPVDLAVDENRNLYILESALNRVSIYDKDGICLAQVVIDATNPKGIAIDSAKNIYVADTDGNRIIKLKELTPGFFDYVLDDTFGVGGFIGSQGSEDSQFNQPWGIGVDSEDNVYVTDSRNNRIQKFDSSGAFAQKWGELGTEEGQFTQPKGLFIDSLNHLYVVDTGNNRIQEFSSDGSLWNVWGEIGTGEGQFNQPLDIAVNPYYIYGVDTGNNRVEKFGIDRQFILQIIELGLSNPSGIVIDTDLKKELIYIADTGNNRVIKIELPLILPNKLWNDMKESLKAGNIEGALNNFAEESKEKYREIFNTLADQLPQLAEDMQDIELIYIKGDIAKYRIHRIQNGREITYYIYFFKDENGEWKIKSF